MVVFTPDGKRIITASNYYGGLLPIEWVKTG
jgi:hypothetical protein